MNSNYLNEYINTLERVLSYAYENNISAFATEKAISYSQYFQAIEKDLSSFSPIINDQVLVDNLFEGLDKKLIDTPVYKQCLWAAEAYLRIQGEFALTFEAIFLYIPLKKMYEYFPLFHEMDFSQIVGLFEEKYKADSVLSVLLDKYHMALSDISKEINVSYQTLFSVKQRRRDIKKIDIEIVYKLARMFHVRIETITELKIS